MKVSEGDALFPWMRVALGALAVVQEMTLKAGPPGHPRAGVAAPAQIDRWVNGPI